MLYVISLQAPQPIEVVAGDTVLVKTTFTYKGKAQTVPVYAGIGSMGGFGFNPVEPNEGITQIEVAESVEFQPYEATVQIDISETLGAGTYDVMAMPSGHPEAQALAEDVVTVAGPISPLSMMLPIMALAMMGMMLPMITGEEEGEEAEVSPVG